MINFHQNWCSFQILQLWIIRNVSHRGFFRSYILGPMTQTHLMKSSQSSNISDDNILSVSFDHEVNPKWLDRGGGGEGIFAKLLLCSLAMCSNCFFSLTGSSKTTDCTSTGSSGMTDFLCLIILVTISLFAKDVSYNYIIYLSLSKNVSYIELPYF